VLQPDTELVGIALVLRYGFDNLVLMSASPSLLSALRGHGVDILLRRV
jgi:hypothetical protein